VSLKFALRLIIFIDKMIKIKIFNDIKFVKQVIGDFKLPTALSYAQELANQEL